MAAVTISSVLQAQDTSSTKQLDDVIVTATKFEQKQNTTGKVVTVISQATLKNQVGKFVSEILNNEVGVFINGANNSFGSNQDIYLRGAGTGNTLILIDGVPVSDPSYINNGFDLNTIAVAQIEKIEILKGAQSTLWGSAYGSYNTLKSSIGFTGRYKKFNYNVSASRITSKGFSSAFDSTGAANFDNDKFKQYNTQVKLGYDFNEKFSASFLSNIGKYKTSLDAGAFRDDKDYTGENINTVHTLDLMYKVKQTSIHFTNSFLSAKRTLLDDSTATLGNRDFYTANYEGRSFISELFGNFSLAEKLSLVAGTQYNA